MSLNIPVHTHKSIRLEQQQILFTLLSQIKSLVRGEKMAIGNNIQDVFNVNNNRFYGFKYLNISCLALTPINSFPI